MGKIVSVFAFLIMLCLSVLTVSRDYVGPIEDISDCSNGSKLEVYCVLSNPDLRAHSKPPTLIHLSNLKYLLLVQHNLYLLLALKDKA